MDDIDAIKANIEDPKNREVVSKLETEMARYVIRKKKLILEYHAKRYPERTDEQSYAHAIIQYFAIVDKCCINPDTENRIQLGVAMREVLSKLKNQEEINIDDFVMACINEKNLQEAFAPFKDHVNDIMRCMTERDRAVEWRDDYMITVAMLFERNKHYYVALLKYDTGTRVPSSLPASPT